MLLALMLQVCGPDTEERIAYIRQTLDAERRRTDIWSWTWASAYGTAAIVQGALIPSANEETKKDFYIGVGSGLFGLLSLSILPLRVTIPIRQMQWDGGDRCAVLALAEATFQKAAAAQREAKGWVGHVGSVIYNIGTLLLAGFLFGHWKEGAISSCVGIVVSQINNFTQPAGLPAAYEAYQRR